MEMTETEDMDELRTRIATVFARREKLKQAMGEGITAARQGFRELEALDVELSELDSRFKQLWDAHKASLTDVAAVQPFSPRTLPR